MAQSVKELAIQQPRSILGPCKQLDATACVCNPTVGSRDSSRVEMQLQ